MNTNLITFEDKVSISQNPSIPDKNKISSSDVNQIKTAINSGLINLIYPVGCYFETSDESFNPNTSWGGVWQLEKDGTVLVSSSSEEDSKFNVAIATVVGEETHTLTVNEIPSHNHSAAGNFVIDGYGGDGQANVQAGTSFRITSKTTNTGGGQAHNNIQPSKVVNRWHRTA